VSGALLVAQVLSLPFYSWLSKRMGKRAGYITGAAIWMICMLASLLINPASPVWLIYAFAFVVGIGTGGIIVMMYSIFPDIPDVDELKTGQRREGIYAALITFMRKFSSAVAIFLLSQVIQLTGYVQPVEEVVEGAARLVEMPQPAGFILALRLVFALLPLVLLVPALFLAARYPLTPELHRRLNAVLERRRQGTTDAHTQAEAEALERALG
jgi:Na+/melibiose symporter-like transporter